MSAVEDRLAEIEGRARENWPTSEDVATLAAALRAVLKACVDSAWTAHNGISVYTVVDVTDIRAATAAALGVTP